MIMSFSVANFRSIGNEQKLSFVSDNAKEHIDNTYPVTDNSKIRWFFRKFVESTEKNITIFISAF